MSDATGTTGLVLETAEAKIDAFQRALISECDRAVRQALRGERDTDGRLYDTVFGLIIAEHVYPLLQAARDDEAGKIEAWLLATDGVETTRNGRTFRQGLSYSERIAIADAIATRSYRTKP